MEPEVQQVHPESSPDRKSEKAVEEEPAKEGDADDSFDDKDSEVSDENVRRSPFTKLEKRRNPKTMDSGKVFEMEPAQLEQPAEALEEVNRGETP